MCTQLGALDSVRSAMDTVPFLTKLSVCTHGYAGAIRRRTLLPLGAEDHPRSTDQGTIDSVTIKNK